LFFIEFTSVLSLQLGEKFSKPPEEDPAYMKTKSLLKSLGLETYEKNFKRGMLNDYTLPLLTDRQVFEFMFCVIY